MAHLVRFEDNGDDIEAGARGRNPPPPEEEAGGTFEAPALGPIEGAQRIRRCGVAAALDFNKDDSVAVEGDEVNLGAAFGQRPVAADHGQAFGFEVAVGKVLGAASESMFRHHAPPARPVAKLIADPGERIPSHGWSFDDFEFELDHFAAD